MRALFDTNILLDIGLARKPFAATAFACFAEAIQSGESPRIAPHTVATFYYIVAQSKGKALADIAVADLIANAEIATFDHQAARRSIELNFSDFEDAMIASAAEAEGMDFIVTRNSKDFKSSPIPALSPEDFLKKLRS